MTLEMTMYNLNPINLDIQMQIDGEKDKKITDHKISTRSFNNKSNNNTHTLQIMITITNIKIQQQKHTKYLFKQKN